MVKSNFAIGFGIEKDKGGCPFDRAIMQCTRSPFYILKLITVGADALDGPAVPIELPMLTDTRGVEGAAPYKR